MEPSNVRKKHLAKDNIVSPSLSLTRQPKKSESILINIKHIKILKSITIDLNIWSTADKKNIRNKRKFIYNNSKEKIKRGTADHTILRSGIHMVPTQSISPPCQKLNL